MKFIYYTLHSHFNQGPAWHDQYSEIAYLPLAADIDGDISAVVLME